MSDMEKWLNEQDRDFNPAKAGDDPIWLGGMKYVRADRIEELEAKLAKAEAETRETLHTLDAWFDRRKLAHAAIDQAVLDAASGYLRTSRSGGMPSEESDLVLGVIQDMARLSVFADLFARTTLAKLTGEKP